MVSVRSYLGFFPGHKVVAEGLHGELHSVPQLVAEVAVAEDTVDVQVDVPACRGGGRIGQERTGERDLSFTLLLVITTIILITAAIKAKHISQQDTHHPFPTICGGTAICRCGGEAMR